jgi:uncharacterized protein YegL
MSLLNSGPVPRRTMVLFFVIDTSGSMIGNKIGAANAAVREVIPMLGDISVNNADAEIRIAALTFSSGFNWLYSEPKLAADFLWTDVVADGLTDLGEACIELSEKLSRKDGGFMSYTTGSFAPVIILMSDGGPTDNYLGGIAKLKENRWFKAGIKIAIAIGDDADKKVLMEFTGNSEAVFEVHNIEALKKVIRIVSVAASQIGSQSSTGGSKQDRVISEVNNQVEDIDGAGNAADTSSIECDDDWE